MISLGVADDQIKTSGEGLVEVETQHKELEKKLKAKELERATREAELDKIFNDIAKRVRKTSLYNIPSTPCPPSATLTLRETS